MQGTFTTKWNGKMEIESEYNGHKIKRDRTEYEGERKK